MQSKCSRRLYSIVRSSTAILTRSPTRHYTAVRNLDYISSGTTTLPLPSLRLLQPTTADDSIPDVCPSGGNGWNGRKTGCRSTLLKLRSPHSRDIRNHGKSSRFALIAQMTAGAAWSKAAPAARSVRLAGRLATPVSSDRTVLHWINACYLPRQCPRSPGWGIWSSNIFCCSGVSTA